MDSISIKKNSLGNHLIKLFIHEAVHREPDRGARSSSFSFKKIKTIFFGLSVEKLISLYRNENINLSIFSFYQELRNQLSKTVFY